MKTDTLALIEFFVEIVCSAADQTPDVPNAHNLDNDNSFFCNVEDNMVQYTSMHDLLKGHDDLLKTLSENWKKEINKPWQMLVQIDNFIIENKAYFERSKIDVRTIMDYVYTIV
jgi:hypothetical protein